jgi:hypothetical protein
MVYLIQEHVALELCLSPNIRKNKIYKIKNNIPEFRPNSLHAKMRRALVYLCSQKVKLTNYDVI